MRRFHVSLAIFIYASFWGCIEAKGYVSSIGVGAQSDLVQDRSNIRGGSSSTTSAANTDDFPSIVVLETEEEFDEGNGVTGHRGSLSVVGMGGNLAQIPTLEFVGMEGVPVEIHRKSVQEASSDDTLSRTTWYGEANDGTVASATLLMDANGRISGSVLEGDLSYEIRANGDNDTSFVYGFDVISVDNLAEELVEGEWAGSLGFDQHRHLEHTFHRSLKQSPSAGAEVTVLVVYTAAAEASEGGTAQMQDLIQLSISQTNTAFNNSGSDVRVRLAGSVRDLTFIDSKSSGVDTFSALHNSGDGFFDYIWEKRTEYAADIVMLIANNLNGYCGVSFIGGPLGAVARVCAAREGQYSFAHEVGHQFTAHHDIAAQGSGDTNRGYVDHQNCFRTIMSYYCDCRPCPRVLYFSNLNSLYNGFSVGSPIENNLASMESYATLLADNMKEQEPATVAPVTAQATSEPSSAPSQAPTDTPRPEFVFCRENPCESRPFLKTAIEDNGGQSARVDMTVRGQLQTILTLHTPAGFYLEMFDQGNFEGNRQVYGHASRDSSFYVQQFLSGLTEFSYIIREVPPGGGVDLCTTINDRRNCMEKGIGNYPTVPRHGFHPLTELELPPRWQVELFELPGYEGSSEVFANYNPRSTRTVRLYQQSFQHWGYDTLSFIVSSVDRR